MKELVDLVNTPRAEWGDKARPAFDKALKARYPRIPDLTDDRAEGKHFQLRVNADPKEGAVNFAALIPPGQERSGPYGGMSFVMFPADEGQDDLFATRALIYSAERILARPPPMLRLRRLSPLSLLNGATPTKAAICFRLRSPSSGR